MSKIKITITLPKSEFMHQVEAIIPNLDMKGPRVRSSVIDSENAFHVYIEAIDTAALRAALGSITRWLLVANKLNEAIK